MNNGLSITSAGEARLLIRAIGKSDIVVVAVVRNEGLRLPAFLDYYRGLGVNRFLIVDNQSDDDSPEFLDEQSDVVRFLAAGSYAASACGVDWTNFVTLAHAQDRWVVTGDADELLVYPRSESRSLHELVAALEQPGANALKAPMLDMYADGQIAESRYTAGESLLESFPFYDSDGYEWADKGSLPMIVRGGPRKRLFWTPFNRDHQSPYLMKVPLFKWARSSPYTMSTHLVQNAVFTRISGLLLHFKLGPDFIARAEEETARGEHFAGARQYRAYHEGVSSASALTAMYEGSQRWAGTEAAVRQGLMHDQIGFSATPPDQKRSPHGKVDT